MKTLNEFKIQHADHQESLATIAATAALDSMAKMEAKHKIAQKSRSPLSNCEQHDEIDIVKQQLRKLHQVSCLRILDLLALS